MKKQEPDIRYGLIGANVSRSLSQAIHSMFGDYHYGLLSLRRDEAEELLRSRAFRGLNVTMPYKRLAFELCDTLSPAARAIGSVNTVVVRDGMMHGDNTDIDGLLYMADAAGIGLTGRKVIICGSGGTSRTAAYAAEQRSALSVVRLSRSPSEDGVEPYHGAEERHADTGVIINTTPLGMAPDVGSMPIRPSDFPDLDGVLDVVYTPLRTRLAQAASRLGLPRSCGLPMLVAQARRAAEIFTGAPVPAFAVEKAVTDLRMSCSNVVLIGMPGCGKTTIGRAVAERLGRSFIDMDAEIEASAGRSIPEIFETDGEERFRALESEEAARLALRTGAVIATGGGAVLRRENVEALAANGVLIWIDAAPATLPTEGRPISQASRSMAELAAKREPFYKEAADVKLDRPSGEDAAAEAVISAWESFIQGGGL